jgi:protein gp37
MKNSSIEWTDHTWNIAVGCTKVDADCKFCYMYRDSMKEKRYDPKTVRKTKTVFNLPLKIKEPSRIFTSSLTDVFHPDCDGFRNEMWDIIRKCPQHTFQILTKRPERIKDHLPEDWGDGWDNVWLGTSVGSEDSSERIAKMLWLCRQKELGQGESFIPAKTIFLSLEPLHGPLKAGTLSLLRFFDWVIVGGESGNEKGKYQYRPCKLEWILSIILQCGLAGVPVFVKQLGTHLSKQFELKDRHGKDMGEWPETLQIRQFPTLKTIKS